MPCNVTGESSRTWTIGRLQRGVHTIEMYVTDSSSLSSTPRYTASLNVGSLEVETTFDQNNYYPANQDLLVPYSVYNSSSLLILKSFRDILPHLFRWWMNCVPL